MLTTNPFDDDKLKEECAVFGIWGTKDAAAHTALGLHAMQHRGQEACGIVSNNDEDFNAHRAIGQVGDVFGDHSVMQRLIGDSSVGHTRYSTAGGDSLRNVQPVYADFVFGGLALAHNGNLTNAISLRNELVHSGSIFQSTTDTEVIIHLIATSKGKVKDRLITALRLIEGAYSLVLLTKKKMIGVRDPRGVRPLVLGKLGDAYMFASETVALDIIGAEFIREVEPGEMITIDHKGLRSEFPLDKQDSRFCVFEYVYFSRPDSIIEGRSVYDARKHIGKELAIEFPVDADVIIPIPDSGVPSAIGFSQESGIPFELGIIRNHYIGRTFIEPTDEIRHLGVKLKHNALKAHIKGKRVVLVDDSIVRGTTSRKIVEMVREAGAKEVHMRISSPPTAHSCFYGVDTPERKSLLASSNSIEQMRDLIGADSLAFVTMDGMYRAMGEESRNKECPQYCDACFSGEYPIPLTDKENKGVAGKQLTNLKEKN